MEGGGKAFVPSPLATCTSPLFEESSKCNTVAIVLLVNNYPLMTKLEGPFIDLRKYVTYGETRLMLLQFSTWLKHWSVCLSRRYVRICIGPQHNAVLWNEMIDCHSYTSVIVKRSWMFFGTNLTTFSVMFVRYCENGQVCLKYGAFTCVYCVRIRTYARVSFTF